ncbi:Chromate resistance protein ChrB [Paenarthrobacter sp. AB444]|uniref:Chromate resistance protein ChrB n=1 Tax=Paenarthrobacter sp. AB444 TaxID=3025681 RepID=UPI0023650054|nr:Chromate resistance protein ChrB [Paenarthrobacter sp. AB444]MDD7834019.1 chromate resistance protein ChrB [Paenarthrobacter sp. AB444]
MIDERWLLILVQVPSQPSRHRVAVWRELRRIGAVPLSPGTWLLPAHPAFDEGLVRAGELVAKGGGTWTLVDAVPRQPGDVVFRAAYEAARQEEWAEFMADCRKFEAEIAKEIAQEKFTFAELEEEEQSLERLRRWFRELKSRDVLHLPLAGDAAEQLARCAAALEGFSSRVYEVMLPEQGGRNSL